MDLNIEAMTDLLGQDIPAEDTWTRRAKAGSAKNLAALRSRSLYAAFDRYKRAAADINRLLQAAGRQKGVNLSLSNYGDPRFLPVRSQDLAAAARAFESNLFYPFFEKRISEAFGRRVPDIVGISVNFMSQAICASAIAGYIRKRFPATRIVFGGGLVTSWKMIPGFSNPLEGIVDDLVAGPGENALKILSGVSETYGNGDPCPGFPYDYDVSNPGQYLSPLAILSVSASHGCYWRKCLFCPERAEKNPYRPYPPQMFNRYLRGLNREPGSALIHFTDNTLSPRMLKHLADHPPGFPWYGFARITPHLADAQFAGRLAESGCVMLQLGIESGDQGVLDAMGKGTTVSTISMALKTLGTAGISVYGYLLFGTPAENEKSALKTRDFILAHAEYIDFLNLAVFNLPAHDGLVKTLETRSFYQGDLSLYREFIHPQGWGRDRIRTFLEKTFKSEAPIKTIINNDPPFFTSHHAPFFRMWPGDTGYPRRGYII